jgi:mycothiol system anti-sigma-R factor
MIDCREAVRRMWTYLEHELGSASTDELERHLENCRRCCGELEFSRRMRDMVAAKEGATGMPPDVRTRIKMLLDQPDGQPERMA